ncbi:VonWillebr and factor type A domain protein [Haloferula helveola]|uniref:vonWillebr and factor type A domain protein n=1 Tax=Haloferula helveola TaxID=490095 RepID=A0ABN6H3R3_9BACT|nr:VonWillebr and factor type A domain protein [Haloferula helveola]
MKSSHLRRSVTAQFLGVLAAFSLPLTSSYAIVAGTVDLELSLVTDISGSVDATEFNLQMSGYSSAFRNPLLHSAIESGPNGAIAVNLIFYDDTASVGVPWTILTNASEANAFADVIDGLGRPRSGLTDPAEGIDLATSEIFNNAITSTRQVIDVSGDGTSSSGGPPSLARDNALAAGIDAINGLPIGSTSLEQYYIDNIQGGTGSFTVLANDFADFQASVLEKLEREIRGELTFGEAPRLLTSGLRTTSIVVARTATRDVGDRLFRMRSGVRSEPIVTTQPAPYSSKGGMAKGGMAKTPITITERCPWEVYGQIFYVTEDTDAQYRTVRPNVPGANFPAFQQLIQPDTSTDIFGGTVGIDYDIDDHWTVGFALSASRAESDMTFVGNVDIDNLTLMPYVSYYRPIGNMAFYADLLYGYGMNEYDTRRLPTGAVGNTDGDFHTLEFNTGLNLRNGGFVHGPLAQIRWLDGEIDSYTETGPGAVFYPQADYESLATQLGYQVSYPMEMAGGTLVPQGRAAWEHEFEEDQGTVAGIPLGELDEDLAVLGLGLGYFTNCGWNAVLDYEARLGSETQSHYVGLKVGKEF